jgi:hypothetical protein
LSAVATLTVCVVFKELHVSATCLRDREGRWSWRLTRESGVRPSVGCVQHIGIDVEDIRGAYMVMEMETPPPWQQDLKWQCIVGWLDKQAVATVVKIAEAFKAAEKEFVLGQDVERDKSCTLVRVVSRGVCEGWFSSDPGGCRCDAGVLFTEGEMCKNCASGYSLDSRFVAQGCFAGVFPLGREHWWKGVTDAVSDVVPWRRALCGICSFDGAVYVCSDCGLV